MGRGRSGASRRVRARAWAITGFAGPGLLTLVLGVLLLGATLGCTGDKAKYPEVHARDGVVPVALAGVAPGAARFHTYRSQSGKKVDFFVYRDSSGEPHAVLDACRTCYRWKMGYVLDGDEVVCLKCEMRFKMDTLAQGSGSCVPIAVRSAPREAVLEIPVAELEAGARFF